MLLGEKYILIAVSSGTITATDSVYKTALEYVADVEYCDVKSVERAMRYALGRRGIRTPLSEYLRRIAVLFELPKF